MPSASNVNLQQILWRLQSAALRQICIFRRRTQTRDLREDFRIARVYHFITNVAGYNRKGYETIEVQMLATLSRAKWSTQNKRCLSLGTVSFGTVQMTAAVTTAIAQWHRTRSVHTVYTAQCRTTVTVKTNQMNRQFQITIDPPQSAGTRTAICETGLGFGFDLVVLRHKRVCYVKYCWSCLSLRFVLVFW